MNGPGRGDPEGRGRGNHAAPSGSSGAAPRRPPGGGPGAHAAPGAFPEAEAPEPDPFPAADPGPERSRPPEPEWPTWGTTSAAPPASASPSGPELTQRPVPSGIPVPSAPFFTQPPASAGSARPDFTPFPGPGSTPPPALNGNAVPNPLPGPAPEPYPRPALPPQSGLPEHVGPTPAQLPVPRPNAQAVQRSIPQPVTPSATGPAAAAGPGSAPSGETGPSEALRLRALARFIKLIASESSTMDVAVAAAAEAYRQLDAEAVSISRWERDTGLLRVLVNHGGPLGEGVSEQPKSEIYPVTDFPTVLLSEDDLGPWVQMASDGSGDPRRVELLLNRGQNCALIAPIVFGGRAWGELYAARTIDQRVYDQSDLDYAEALSAQIAAGLARAGQMEHIEKLALTDQLTGLANRRAFDTRLDAAMDRHNHDGTVVSLVLCDGNGLKRINDTHGHDHGDALLVELGACVSAAASRLPRSLAARFGGDEFCLLIEGFTADDAVAAAEDMCLRALTVRGGEGMSCGVASTGDPIGRVATRDGLFRLADAAQYRAKRSRSLSPVVAGRGQPPDPELPLQQRGMPVATVRGRAAVPIEALLSQGLAGLDKLPPTAQRADRVEVIVDQVARGLDAASWYIYRRTGQQGPLYQERSAVYRATSESGSYPIPGVSPQLRQTELSPTSPPQWIEPIPRVAEQLRGFGAVTPAVGQDSNWSPGDLGISPEFLAAAGYTSALSAGATASDGSQWLVAILLDEISLWALPALPLLRVLLASSVTL